MTECRLLIVDDSKVFLDQLEITIDREHKPYAEEKGIALSIEKAYSPADLKKLDGKTYDIILSDLCLANEDEENPGNSTAIQWLETIKDTEPIIILLSAYIDNDEIVKSIIEKLDGIRMISKDSVSLWKLQLFSALGQFRNHKQLKYMDRNLRKFVMKFNEGEELTMRYMAILFADIRNFTKLCDYFQKQQKTICQQMEVYFNEVEKIIYKYGGIFDKILGDGIMAEFIDFEFIDFEFTDASIPHNYLQRALVATEELVYKFTQLKKNLIENLLHKGKPEEEAKQIIENLRLGCGIYAGNINFGSFGGEERKHFTAIGHEVNMAQRLESAARIENIPSKYRRGIQHGQEVAAIILLSDVVANELVIKEQMKLYKQIPTTSLKKNASSKKGTSKQGDVEKLYIRNYNNNDINRNVYGRIIPE